MRSLMQICVLILTIFYAVNAWAWNDNITHRYLSEKAVEFSILSPATGNYIRNLGLIKGLDERFEGTYSVGTEARRKNYTVTKWVGAGGVEEDSGNIFTAYYYHHFHNPLRGWDTAGLTTPYPLINGESSLIWAQDDEEDATPLNPWRWQRIREYYYSALTSTTEAQRRENFVNTFKGLGHIIHLIEDAAQPAHVRDDPHPLDDKGIVPQFEHWAKDPRNQFLISSFMSNPVYPDVSLNTQVGSYIPITQFWDTDQYNGGNPNIAIGNAIGISEYTNANFFSEDTIFTDGFTYPAWSGVEEYEKEIDNITGEVRTYLRKTSDGEIIQHLAAGRWFYKYLPAGYKRLGFKLDDNVYAEYASLLLPRAVGYSAALIDYFFRGSIELTPPDRFLYSITAPGGSFNDIRVKVRNVTPNGEEMPNGSIQLVVKYRLAQQDPFQSYPVPRDPESYIVAPEKNGVTAIPRDMPVELVFDLTTTSIPLWATDVSLQVVYGGVLGNEADAVAVGFKDISEPTPVDIINNMDYVCINGSYYVAGSPEALSLVDMNLNGIADEADIYSHGLSDIYLLWTSLSSPRYASATDYHASFSTLAPGSYGRIFILTEYEHYLSRQQTLSHSDPQDQWGWSFGVGLSIRNGLKNQDEYINGVLTRTYPTFESWRGINAWTGVRYENPAVPYGTSCITAPPTGLTGPVGFGMP